MIRLAESNQKHYWSLRKLLVTYQFLRLNKSEANLDITDLAFPLSYPRNCITGSYEAFRLLICLNGLSSIGVEIDSAPLNEKLGLIDLPNSIRLSLPTNHIDLMNLLSAPVAEILSEEGEGDLSFYSPLPEFNSHLKLPVCYTFQLKIDRKKLRKHLHEYLKDYRQDRLHHDKKVFGYTMMKRLFERFWKELELRQGVSLHWTIHPDLNNPNKFNDEFTQVFKRDFPNEFNLWRKGEYELRIFEYVFASEALQQIKIVEISSEPIAPSNFTPSAIQDFLCLNKTPIRASIRLKRQIPRQKTNFVFWQKFISKVEVVPSKSTQYWVYLNGHDDEPIILNKNTQTGKLWYLLAEQGSVPYRDFKSAYQYVNTDKRFKFFAKTKYSFAKMLEIDSDQYIVTRPGIQVMFKL